MPPSGCLARFGVNQKRLAEPAKPERTGRPYTRFDWAPAVMTLPREAGSTRRSVGDRDRVPATKTF